MKRTDEIRASLDVEGCILQADRPGASWSDVRYLLDRCSKLADALEHHLVSYTEGMKGLRLTDAAIEEQRKLLAEYEGEEGIK